MKYRTTSILICVAASLLLVASACVRGVRPAPDLTYLDIIPGKASPAESISGDVLLLHRIGIQSPFDDRRLNYRTGPGTFEPDYYIRFVAAPSDIVTGRLETWLAESRLFQAVVESGTSVEYRYILEGEIIELYGDYSNPQQPSAVITAEFTLVDDAEGMGRIVLNNRYRQVVPVSSPNPDGLAAGWGTALRNMFLDLTADIQDRFSGMK